VVSSLTITPERPQMQHHSVSERVISCFMIRPFGTVLLTTTSIAQLPSQCNPT
jgi:hypothetical protein